MLFKIKIENCLTKEKGEIVFKSIDAGMNYYRIGNIIDSDGVPLDKMGGISIMYFEDKPVYFIQPRDVISIETL